MMHNSILNTDSYKTSHFNQYPPNTVNMNSYIESRGGKWAQTVFFGLQMFLKEYLCTPLSAEHIAEAETMLKAHGVPFHAAGWKHILDHHGGFLPVVIEAIPEGTVIDVKNCLVQIRATDPACFWLPSYLETALLRGVWYPTTVCTLSHEIKKLIFTYLERTADDPAAEIDFKLHDFGSRGASSYESAALGGVAHLVNFKGTDTVIGLAAAKQYYHCDMAGFSIPAMEHSTVTSWESEVSAYENMVETYGAPNALYACVSDSYDIYTAIEYIWPRLNEKVLAKGGTVVIRLDSGDPVTMVRDSLETLMQKFGFTTNSKGFRVLPQHIRVLQGDGVNEESIEQILSALHDAEISASNLAFGMGGALLQKMNRDTLKFAMKCSAIQVNDNGHTYWRDVFKNPISDPGKISKRGILAVNAYDGTHYTMKTSPEFNETNCLRPVFQNGELLVDDDFATIRERVQNTIAS